MLVIQQGEVAVIKFYVGLPITRSGSHVTVTGHTVMMTIEMTST